MLENKLNIKENENSTLLGIIANMNEEKMNKNAIKDIDKSEGQKNKTDEIFCVKIKDLERQLETTRNKLINLNKENYQAKVNS